MLMGRRRFLASTGAAALAPAVRGQDSKTVSANDHIQIAVIGAGGMGSGDVQTALGIPGVRLVAAADIYDGRLIRAKEVWGKDLYTTRDYREILTRKDVDAVIVATPDHWHARMTIDALAAGKDVYCQKPMVQKIEQGHAVIDAARKSGRILQIGSQYVSSSIYLKAREIIQRGDIGQLNVVDAWLDRNTALGAWQYTIPPDASEENIDWDRFLGNAPKRPFEPIRLFRWRNYRDYGTGVAGDLFVHLFSGLHAVTGSIGPRSVYASGGIRYWKDGRDVPDVMLAVIDYPESASHPAFTFSLRVNLKSGVPQERFGFQFSGSDGVLTTGSTVTLSRPAPERAPGYSISTFPKAVQEQFLKEYDAKYPGARQAPPRTKAEPETVFVPPRGYSAHDDHHRNFFSAVRSRRPVVEDAVFGFRAAGPALLANESCDKGEVVRWDPERMQVIA
jgi:predicted dehydrogenase